MSADDGEDTSELASESDASSAAAGPNVGDEQDAAVELDAANTVGSYTEINGDEFGELLLQASVVEAVQQSWSGFMTSADSREAAGESIYSAIFDAAPSLQSLFKTPRAVMAMRFMNGLNTIINLLSDPTQLKVIVETLGFQHLELEVTVPRVAIFRDAIVDLLRSELGARWTVGAEQGWDACLNYVGGAYTYVRVKYTGRLKILASSWAVASQKSAEEQAAASGEEIAAGEEGDSEGKDSGEAKAMSGEKAARVSGSIEQPEAQRFSMEDKAEKQGRKLSLGERLLGRRSDPRAGGAQGSAAARSGQEEGVGSKLKSTSVPNTYNEMFAFNAAVMGYGRSIWMQEVLMSFDAIVTNVSNSYRLQEECDILSLRIAKYKGNVNLSEYKAVMLASLRSLVPKGWNSEHEVAWTWLWENVERMLMAMQGKPLQQERALEKLWGSLDEAQQSHVRREVYSKFFRLAPAGQDYFKQSTTRLHFIADRIVSMTLEIYKDPKKMVEDISALGLRHVGYGIPTELFGPFVTACVTVVRSLTDDDLAEEAFRWSLNLIARVLTRVINEGSTIVMKAINQNSAKLLRKAVSCAPRGKRALWMLSVQVGTQSISPLLWAMEAGSLEAAKAIIQDLLTIRADRDRYYYGMDILFERHPDIIRRLCVDAPALLPVLLDGLVWRSRQTSNGVRRVNFYIRHLLVDAQGEFSEATEWLKDNNCPKIICHPVVVQTTDALWSHLAFTGYLYGKSWFLFTLIVFVFSQAVLKRLHVEDTLAGRGAVFGCRCFIYLFSMGHWIYYHTKSFYLDFMASQLVWLGQVPMPTYLRNWQDSSSLLLTLFLFLMFCIEPIMSCMDSHGTEGDFRGAGLFSQHCPGASNVQFTYSLFSMCAMILYYMLALDLSVFNTTFSAFVLLCGRVLSELALFSGGLVFVILTFAAAVSALDHDVPDFAGIPTSALSMLRICLRMYGDDGFEALDEDPAALILICVYTTCAVIFLVNMLIAQLNCAYRGTYEDMVGFARLNRAKILVEVVPNVSSLAWERFLHRLRLDDNLEFGEGDLGVTGGIQVLEPASANVTTVDSIRRFGGSTSPLAQWPMEAEEVEGEDRFEKLEKMIEKAVKRMSRGSKNGRQGSGKGGDTSNSFGAEDSGSADSVLSQQ